ncbi:MAG: hypothetical protein AAB459_01135 [Patescibacteria group bacterium]
MKKVILLFIGLVLLIFGGFIYVISSTINTDLPSTALPPARLYKVACEVFTLQDAKIFSEPIIEKLSAGGANTIADGKADTTCSYGLISNTKFPLSITIKLHDSTAEIAKEKFQQSKSAFPITVQDLGQDAHWQTDSAQLNVLKGQYWLVVSAGAGDPKLRQMDLPVRIAQHILSKL